MGEATKNTEPETIDRVAMDALVYGFSKGLDYLGELKKEILDASGDLMLGYLIEVGSVASPNRPEDLARSLRDLFAKNGYGLEISVQFTGSPPAPSIPNFVLYLGATRTGPKGSGKVDWVLYEMVLYGMTKALDGMGMQAQLILNRIGMKMLDYLVEIGAVEHSDDPFVFFDRVKDFFIKAGYARDLDFQVEGTPIDALMSTWTSARYYSTVFKRLQSEGSPLLSCPLCLAGSSILMKSRGWKVQNAVEYRALLDGKFFMRTKVYQSTERFTEEDAERISRMTE